MESIKEVRSDSVKKHKAVIDQVIQGSIADEVGIEKGDVLLSINGKQPVDLIDYRFLCAEEDLEVEVQKEDGEVWVCEIEKEYDEDLGLGFIQDTFDGIKNCANKCIFCFVDQMPVGMRETLYVKDDDYRLSFLHGNFVTLTNLSSSDMDRIIRMRLSPLYISVHTTNPELRREMLGSQKAGDIMKQLSRLAEAGIEMHTQIVLCPGKNDGAELEKTVHNLAALWPQVRSIAVVPVGLTGFRTGLSELRKFSFQEAERLVDMVGNLQHSFIKKYRSPLLYLADEFYVLARKDFPQSECYGEFPQLENGVGLVRLFYDSFDAGENDLPDAIDESKNIALVTGESGQYVLKPITDRLNRIKNLNVELISVHNSFFGGHVSVAGLLSGTDIINALRAYPKSDLVLLPSVMCKKGEPVFLDGKTKEDIEVELRSPVKIVDVGEEARDLIKIICDLKNQEV